MQVKLTIILTRHDTQAQHKDMSEKHPARQHVKIQTQRNRAEASHRQTYCATTLAYYTNFCHIWKTEFPNSTLLQIRNYLFQRDLSYLQYAWAKIQRYKTKVQYMNRSIISTIYMYIGDEVQTPCHLWMRYTHPAILNTQKQGKHRLEKFTLLFFLVSLHGEVKAAHPFDELRKCSCMSSGQSGNNMKCMQHPARRMHPARNFTNRSLKYNCLAKLK